MTHNTKPKQLVVQCPACHAKFALPAGALDGVEFPRFHCSRCDHIFSKEENLFRIEEPSAAEAAEPAAPEDRWMMGKPAGGRSLEVPRSYDRGQAVSAPHENISEEAARRGASRGTSQMDLDFSSTPAAEDAAEPWPASDLSAAALEKEELGGYREAPAHGGDRALAKLPAQAAWEALRRERPAVWKGCAYLAAPVVLFLMLLWGASALLRANASLADRISQGLFPGADRVAPPGLLINRLREREVMLEDGERVHLISGELENRTDRAFLDVQLEALTFDAAGRKLDSLRVDAGSTLAKTRVKSLSWEMIRELQSRLPVKRFELKPEESSEFAIALPPESEEAPRYYSARIYSVRSRR